MSKSDSLQIFLLNLEVGLFAGLFLEFNGKKKLSDQLI